MKLPKIFRNKRRPFLPDKRQRIALQTVFLTALLVASQVMWEDYRFIMVSILAVSSYILTAWSLKEDIKGLEWLLLFILPVTFTASVSFFYFLLPARWITRLIITMIFAVGIYAILLVENIYNVAAERSIQLIRVAHSVGLLVSLAVVFLSANIVYSLRLPFWENMIILFFITFVISLQSLWSVKLESKPTSNLLLYSSIVALGVGQLAFALSFWPVENAAYSLLITASYYVLTGIIQHHFMERLFWNSIREYILVFVFTVVLAFVATRWGR